MSCLSSKGIESSVILNSQNLKRKRSPSKERIAGHATDVQLENKRPKLLRITIPSSLNSGLEASPKKSSSDSLFSAIDSAHSLFDDPTEESSLEPLPTDSVFGLRTDTTASALSLDPSVLLLPQETADAAFKFPDTLSISLNPHSPKSKRSSSKERATATYAVDLLLENDKPSLLRVVIPTSLNTGLEESSSGSLFSATESVNSLFDEPVKESFSTARETDDVLASRTCPPVSGLYFHPSVLLPQEIADEVVAFCMKTYFILPLDNQVMLFGRFAPSGESTASGLPPILLDLLDTISALLKPVIPPETYELLFPAVQTRARQAIINLYHPGEGITPHVDLLGRYDDGIVGVSFSSGCVMRFDRVKQEESAPEQQERYNVYLPERSVIVMTEEARYDWTHGIDKKTRDLVSPPGSTEPSEAVWIDRGMRMSVTFRWLLPGGDVVGEQPKD
ncbi:hypothetical protein BDN70DRAFT_894342 [Pholiota conissans]|uniref:Fe2OG dioxygenase domain-containing protein n=1 Tax=Pholiota conissans TaxID=109636 RepID=A0A9P6D1A0_9AGAR|nr:hypothetical protein BDN70DRAFT_894342 [Pholiota conissans]